MLLVTLSPRLIYWAKILSKFISIQLVVQALSFASGILLIRTLDQTQYAYFTIANSMQATMNLLADTGISISLTAIGGKVWQDRYRFGQLINTAMQLRYSLAAISITVVTPILIWILNRNGASVGYTVLITIVVLVGFIFQITTDVLMVVLRLHSQIDRIQNLDLFSAVARLVLLGVAYLTFLNSIVVIATTSIVIGLQRLILGHWASENIDSKASICQKDKKAIVSIVVYQTPNTVYYCFQGQLVILLISIFGNTNSIADVAALGRIGIIFSVLSAVMVNIILPSFSRCQSASLLWRRYLQVLIIILTFAALMISFVVFFPDKLLWILGNRYAHLQKELLLIVINTIFGFLVGSMWSINAAKAWVKYSWINIPFTLVVQIALLLILDVSKVTGVIMFSLISQLPPFLVNIFLTYRGIAAYR